MRYVALLRAVNVGARKVPMARLRELCTDFGWSGVVTYIQSGNVVFETKGRRNSLENTLEQALEQEFGFDVPCMVRSAREWRTVHASNPFPEATADAPNRVMAGIAKGGIARDAAERLAERARDGEEVKVAGEVLWIHYPGGSGRSALTPALLDRAAGFPVTTRNARTVERLMTILDEPRGTA